MPSVSRAQQKAMFAAKSGKSTVGIPQQVGADYAAADEARGPAPLPARASEPSPKKGTRAERRATNQQRQAMVDSLKG